MLTFVVPAPSFGFHLYVIVVAAVAAYLLEQCQKCAPAKVCTVGYLVGIAAALLGTLFYLGGQHVAASWIAHGGSVAVLGAMLVQGGWRLADQCATNKKSDE